LLYIHEEEEEEEERVSPFSREGRRGRLGAEEEEEGIGEKRQHKRGKKDRVTIREERKS
jgi:hypothetical protein